MSNSKIASQKTNPFEKSAIRRGSHTIGIGCLKCMSFLNPYWESAQNFVLTDVSKWYPTIFFVKIFRISIMAKLSRTGTNFSVFLNAVASVRIRAASIIVKTSFLSM